jgi:hypothetical protein
MVTVSRIFGLKEHEILGKLRKVHNEGLNNFFFSLNIIRMIKSSRMRRARHLAHMGEKRNAYRILVESQMERYHWEDLVQVRE